MSTVSTDLNLSLSQIVVAMSGGVDSSVTAALLKAAGAKVTGIYMKNWSDPRDCSGVDDRADALKVAVSLGIPFHVFDFEKEYKDKVIDYFYEGYRKGLTPNPDIMCNKEIKFKIFLDQALKLGVDYIATGHYARVRRLTLTPSRCPFGHLEGETERTYYQLLAGVDPTKDQSYFLYTLGQKQLKRVIFPLGGFRKSEVRSIAKELGLPVYNKRDSQGICFVGEVKIKEFLARRLPNKRGPIVDLGGKIIGDHDGAYFYTLGQREGLGIGGGIPYYVVGKNVQKNELIVAPLNQEDILYSKSLKAVDVHWVSGEEPKFPLKAMARIRHLQPFQEVIVTKDAKNRIMVEFQNPQRAISPGQSVVIYDKDIVLGGGVIT